MRSLAPLMLAGLLAVTATAAPASALCADDGNGGCSALRHDLLIHVQAHCKDGAALCLVGDGNETAIPSDAVLNLTVVNSAGVPLDFEVLVTARHGDAQASDGSEPRVRADRILLVEDVAPGERRTVEARIAGDASHLRLQALAQDARQAELDAELLAIRTLAYGDPSQDAEDLADDSGLAPEGGDGEAAGGKDAPSLPALAVLVAVAAAALVAGLRRDD